MTYAENPDIARQLPKGRMKVMLQALLKAFRAHCVRIVIEAEMARTRT